MFATIDALEGNGGYVIGLGATVDESIREPAEYEGVPLHSWNARLAELRKLTLPCTDDVARAVASDGGPVRVQLRGRLCRGRGAGSPEVAQFLDLVR